MHFNGCREEQEKEKEGDEPLKVLEQERENHNKNNPNEESHDSLIYTNMKQQTLKGFSESGAGCERGLGLHLNGPNHYSSLTPWIFDCGATDTMTYDSRDLKSVGPMTRTHIQTASGEKIGVLKAGSVDVSLRIRLNNCLLMLSISQLTKELNCTVLMTSSDCIV